jgi:hypothetical protein
MNVLFFVCCVIVFSFAFLAMASVFTGCKPPQQPAIKRVSGPIKPNPQRVLKTKKTDHDPMDDMMSKYWKRKTGVLNKYNDPLYHIDPMSPGFGKSTEPTFGTGPMVPSFGGGWDD